MEIMMQSFDDPFMCALYIVYKLSTRHCRWAVGYLVHTNRSCLRIVYVVQYWTCLPCRERERRNTDFIDKPRNIEISCWSIDVPMIATSNFQLLHVISMLFTLYTRVWYVPSREANVYEGSPDQPTTQIQP